MIDRATVEQAVAEAHRREWAFVLAATVRVTRDLDAAEEAVQDAYVQALRTWTRDGVPERPGAWLTTVARRTALNGMKREQAFAAKLPLLVEPVADDWSNQFERAAPDAVPDDRLRLIFTCCHPALAPEARIALTLRLACGVATEDVARVLLVSAPTMAARLTRAKKKIAAAGIPYRVPAREELPARLDAVLTVLHLLSTTGHTAPSGETLVRDDVAARALELTRTLHALLPEQPETGGLLALVLVHQARSATRTDADGRLLRLDEQDRMRWDRGLIAEAHALVDASLRAPQGPPGRFTLQAAIASLHAHAPSYAATDWPQVVALYDALLRVWPIPVVALNRAVAVAEVDGPAAALDDIAEIEATGLLAAYHYLPATKADLLRRLGRADEAVAAYRAAHALAVNAAERSYLAGRIAALASD